MGGGFSVPLEAVGVVIGVIGLMCAAACITINWPRRQRMFTPLELDEIRIRREEEKECLLEDQIQLLQARQRVHSHNRTILTARAATGRMVDAAGAEAWDAKGRALYGQDAWDVGQDGHLPLRQLFNLPAEEIHSAKQEAAQRVLNGTHRDSTAPPTPSQQPMSYDADRGLQTARAHREVASKPLAGAPFDDPRFTIPRLGQVHTAAATGAGAGASARSTGPPQVPPLALHGLGYSIQAPGLSSPAPPTVPYTRHESISLDIKPSSARTGSARRTGGSARIAP